MDAFFASVEQRDDPSLRGKPVLVGGRSGRGVVTAASYEARRFGCRSAMPMAQALRLCPHAICVPGRHAVYGAVSRQVMQLLGEVTPDVQPVSVDEAYLDVSGVLRHHGAPSQLAGDGVDAAFAAGQRIGELIRARVRAELSLTCSVGVAGNKLVAKIASDLSKPDGLRTIRPAKAETTLAPLPVGVLRGIGPRAEEQLASLGIRRVGDLVSYDERALVHALGDQALSLRRMARGEDDRPVHPGEQNKSIGKEETFGQDIGQLRVLEGVLMRQCEAVCRELRRDGLRCRTVTLKLRTGDFATSTRSETLETATDALDRIWPVAKGLLEAWGRLNPARVDSGAVTAAAGPLIVPLRLLGVSLHQLTAGGQQLDLFSAAGDERASTLDRVTDAIAKKFGAGSIGRLRGLDRDGRTRGGRRNQRPS